MEKPKKKAKASTQLAYSYNVAKHAEHQENKISQTVPDETLSIKEILDRYTSGRTIGDAVARQTSFDPNASFDSEDLEKIKHEDLFDQEERKRDLKSRIKDHEKQIEEDRKKEKLKNDQEKQEQLDLKKLLKSNKETGVPPQAGGDQGLQARGQTDGPRKE